MPEHLILSQFINTNNSIFNTFWIISVIITAIIWLYYKHKERKVENAYQNLKIEPNQFEMFCFFIYGGKIGYTFKKLNFANFIQRYDYKKYKNNFILFSPVLIESDIAYEIAELIIKKLIRKEFIKKVETETINDEYELLIESTITIG